MAGRTNGVYYAWWLSNARVAGINNVGETSFSSELAIPYVAGQASAGPTMIPATIDIVGRGYDYNQNLNSTDPDGTPVSYQLITNPASPDFGPASSIPGLSISQIGTVSISASNTAAMNLGRWVYKVRVTDGTGATAERDILVVAQDGGSNTPPVLNPIGSQAVAVNTPLSFSVSGTDPTNGQTLVLRAQRLPPGATFPSATNISPATVSSTFNWTPTNGQEGTYTVNFEVFDNASTPLIDSELVTITVTGGNSPPVLDPIGNRAVTNAGNLTFTITGSDPDAGQSVSFQAFNLPAGATFDTNTATFTWTPSPAQYDNTFSGITFRARDDGTPNLTDDETITITVGAGNRPPVVVPVDPQTILAGQALTFNVTASDSNTAQIITLRPGTGGLPPGATFPIVQGPSSGIITSTFSWTPTIFQVGVHNVRFRVEDNGTPILGSEIIVPITVVAPDLTPTTLGAPTMVSVQESISVSWTVSNSGTAQAPPSWVDRLYLSTDNVYDVSDTHLGGFTRSSAVPAGSNYVQSQTVAVPSVTAGNYFLILRADSDNGLTEINEGNNVRSTPLSVSVPDLVVHSVVAPPVAQFGQTIDVIWTVTNSGAGVAVAGWSDRLLLSSDTIVGGDTALLTLSAAPFVPLLPSTSYTRTQSVTLPLTVSLQPGNYFILATVDSGNSQFETNQNNNTTNTPIALSIPPLPDLVVTNIVAPVETFTERAFNVSWTICNQGQAAANGTWVDRVYLSIDDQVGSDRLLGEFPFSAGLTPGQCLTRVQSLNISRSGLAEGQHRIIVITDAANNLNEHNNETNNATVDSDPILVRFSPQPDLRVTRVQAPANAFSSQQAVVEWDVTNAGNGSTGAANWQDYVWLSTDAVFDGSDIFLGQAQNASYLNAGDSYRNTLAFNLPQGIDGDYFIIVKADGNNAVNEFAGENDNFGSGPMHVTLTPPPDLRVFSVTAPGTAFSGQPMNVSWRITNSGPGRTLESSWRDEVFLCRTNFLDGSQTALGTELHSGVLNEAADYAVMNRSVTLPIGISGNYYVLIRADTFNNVFEHVFEANNVGSETSPTMVNLTPPPDLEVELVSLPANALASQPLTVSYRVANNGATVTPNSSWNERCYLSSDTVLSPGTDLLLGNRTHFGALDAGLSYSNTFTATLPVGLSGMYYAIVQIDAGNQVFELVKTNNTRASASTVSVTWQPPDLAVELVSLPTNALASHSLTVNYRVANVGVITTPNNRWNERWFLSADQTLDPNSDLLLATRNHFGSLNAGQSYTDSLTATLPDGLSGVYYAIVQTDSGNEVAELVKANNTGSSSNTVLVESRPADLVVSALDTPFDGLAGDVISVSWQVINSGTGDSVKSRWNDRLILSSDLIHGNGDDLVLINRAHDGALASGEDYFVDSQTVPIPLTVDPGTYYLFLLTDTDGQVYEGAAENNNVSAPRTIFLSRITADLAVTRVSAPSVAQGGQTIRVEWAVDNIGAAGTFATYWSDSVYISHEETLDHHAILIGTRQHSNELPPGGSYSNGFDYTFPPEASGDYYVIVLADADERVLEPGAEVNNTLATTNVLHVTPAPLADLALTAIAVPTEAFAGQTLEISWTVRNIGPGAASRNWYDAVYLSLDQVFDRTSDVYVGYADRPQALTNGQEYIRTASFTVPSGLVGPYYVFVAADSGGVVGEGGSEANNIVGSPVSVLVRVQAPADLVVGTITIPTNAVAGQSVTLTYTVHNIGSNTASGTWIDSVYFSADGQWDLDDALFARVTHSGVVPPGGSYTKTVTAPLPGLVPDDYHVIVRSDIRNQFPESNETNNLGASLDFFETDLDELLFGIPKAGAISQGQSIYYRLTASAGQTISVSLTSAVSGAANEVYIRHGQMPTRANFDFAFSSPQSADQEVVAPTTQAGTYYVLVYGRSIPGGSAAYTIQSDQLVFGLRSVTPNIIGNVGTATVALQGGQLGDGTIFILTDQAGNEVDRTAFIHDKFIPDAATAFVKLKTDGLTPGTYLLHATNGSNVSASIPITVANGAGERWALINGPSNLRPGQSFEVSVRYGNSGISDLLPPMIIVSSLSGNELTVSGPTGERSSSTLVLLGMASDGLSGTLRPGSSGKIDITSRATTGLADIKVDIVEPGERQFDWEELGMSIGAQGPDWDGAVAAVRLQLGETYGEIVRHLATSANRANLGLSAVGFNEWLFWEMYVIQSGGSAATFAAATFSPAADPTYTRYPPPWNMDGGFDPSRDVSVEPIVTPTHSFDSSRPTTIIIHGWKNDKDEPWMRNMAEKIIEAEPNRNVVIVGWGPGADRGWPWDAAYNINATGKEVARQLQGLGVEGSDADFIGHSFGTYVANEAAREMGGANSLVALDPASRAGLNPYKLPDTDFESNFDKSVAYHSSPFAGSQFTTADLDLIVQSDCELLQEICRHGYAYEWFTRQIQEMGLFGLDGPPASIEPGFHYDGVIDLAGHFSPGHPLILLDPRREFWQELGDWWDDLADTVDDAFDDFWDRFRLRIPTIFAIDPNDIIGPVGFGAERFVSTRVPIPYTIRFENDPNLATAPAQVVRVTQFLDPHLDFRTFRLSDFGFGALRVTVPENRSFYQTVIDLRAAQGILVEVAAGINIATGEAFWDFTSIDPETGELPTDALAGFLPVNTNSPAGEGFVSYSIRARSDVLNGDVVNAQARIVFDINEPIDTPPIFNTLDPGIPTSAVQPLPPIETNTTFLVSWAGSDPAGGSAIASYDIYVATDGGQYVVWLANTLLASTYAVGERGHRYDFYSVARDNVGNREAAPASPDATIRISDNLAPLLAPVGNYTAPVGSLLMVTNTATDANLPAQTLRFSLTPGAPSGVTINPASGVLRWQPQSIHAGSNHSITVSVTDDGEPPLSHEQTFTVTVPDYVEITGGTTVVLSGETGTVPMRIFTSVGLSDARFELPLPPNRLSSPTIVSHSPQIASATVQQISDTRWVVTLGAVSPVPLPTAQPQIVLGFSAQTTPPSAFVPLLATSITATRTGGSPVPTSGALPGRVVVVVNPVPLLEMVREANGDATLFLYGNPGTRYAIESKATLNTVPWLPWWEGALADYVQGFSGAGTNGAQQFFRAKTVPLPP